MLTAARNPTTTAIAPKSRAAGAERPAQVEPKAPRWIETRAIAAMVRSFA
jgi:hypothetical protein